MAAPDAGDVARMRRIIDRLRSYGVEVREMPGWETRGFRFPVVPIHVFDHHDASSRKSGEWGSLGLILDGTPRGIPGPLSNFQVARCLDGKPRVAVVAAGYTYHAGTGGPYGGLPTNDANPRTYGTEKANDGLGEPYTAAANYATNALFHAVAIESGGSPATFPVGHKEWTTRKTDPLYSMADRRRQVAAFNPQGDDLPTPADIFAAPLPSVGDGTPYPYGSYVTMTNHLVHQSSVAIARVEAQLAVQGATIGKLVEALGAQDESIDVEALKSFISSEVNRAQDAIRHAVEDGYDAELTLTPKADS